MTNDRRPTKDRPQDPFTHSRFNVLVTL